FQLCTFVVAIAHSAACVKKKKGEQSLTDRELNHSTIISYPEKPMFPVASSSRVAESEVDVELNLDGLAGDQPPAPQEPQVEVSNVAPAE
ncbi:hypothetical protein Tcan_00881, partial [Toxocara canis]